MPHGSRRTAETQDAPRLFGQWVKLTGAGGAKGSGWLLGKWLVAGEVAGDWFLVSFRGACDEKSYRV
ncbi:hypothetical protein JXA40_07010 [bacterium]|nr:hypothetical protein [candidate division CSSED10-310 bacterium]